MAKKIYSAFLVPLSLAFICSQVKAADAPTTQLPPPAKVRIEFDRDIAPIFEKSCLRCHGEEKPKSHFRLDNRMSALKGGREGIDIIPGNSAQSPLIRYCARADEQIKMPPDEKEKLTNDQVGLLRAWVDQGAQWGTPGLGHGVAIDTELTLGGFRVHGNQGKFRELEWTRDGLSGGVKSFSIVDNIRPDEKFSAEGHYLYADQDFQLKLALTKDDLGFVRAGFEQWRKYTENNGAYDPAVAPPEFTVQSNLFLNEGRAWLDLGLTLPNWPAITLGYEYQYRDGTESTLDWGYVQGVNIYPAMSTLDEATHIIKLDIAGEMAGWSYDENARVEIHSAYTRSVEPNIFGAGPGPDTLINSRDVNHSVQGMNTLVVERQFQNWGHASAGYYYSLESDDSYNQTTTGADNTPFFGNYWSAPQVILSTESHIFSLAGSVTPTEYLSLSLASQNEWTHEEGFGGADWSPGLPTVPALFLLQPVSNDSDLNKFKASQNATARFTKIPFTVLFADAEFSQEEIGEFQEQVGGVPEAFSRKTDSDSDLFDIRSGFNVSPWAWLSWNSQYHFTSSDTAYNHVVDSTPFTGYPAFILGRQIRTDDVETKVILKPARWLKTTLSYDIARTVYSTQIDPVTGGISPGGPLTAGAYHANNYGLNFTLTPLRSLYLTEAFSYSDSKTITANNGDPSVAPYKGHVITLTSSAGYVVSKTVDLNLTYLFSAANYAQNNAANGVPLGLNFARHNLVLGLSKKFNPHLSAALHFIYSQYTEPSAGSFNDYYAQGIFATMSYSWR